MTTDGQFFFVVRKINDEPHEQIGGPFFTEATADEFCATAIEVFNAELAKRDMPRTANLADNQWGRTYD